MSTYHTLEKPTHVVGLKGRLETYHLIEDASKRPDITFKIIGFILPNFWTCIVGSPGLGVVEAFLTHNF